MAKGTGSEVIEVIINKPEMTFEGYLMNNLESDDAERKTYIFFMGIPYAKPPLGDLRFQPPQSYVYDADRDGKPYKAMGVEKTAIQSPGLDAGLTKHELKKLQKKKRKRKWKSQHEGVFPTTEDCLYLNIYVPMRPEEISKPLAVMVYFHGGGFFHGSGNYSERTPESMMLHDILLVMVNYRLGPFGFLNMHSEKCKGNAGLKDQVKALEWVRDNIGPFGGDPDNVTICGESAGGSCVNFHLLSPLSKGLFKRAIIQSGGIYCPWGYSGDQRKIMKSYEKFSSLLEGSQKMMVEKLLEADAEDILYFDAHMDYLTRPAGSVEVHLGPSIESYIVDAFIPYGVEELMKDAEPVPILAGITALDGYSIFVDEPQGELQKSWILNDKYFCELLGADLHWESDMVQRYFREIRDEYFDVEELKELHKIRESYLSKLKNTFLCGSKPEPEASGSGSGAGRPLETKETRLLRSDECVAKLITDLWFHRFYDNFKLGGATKKPAPLYVYEFDLVSDLNLSKDYSKKLTSAAHCDDLVYLFCPAYNRQLKFPFSDDIKQKITTMCSLWASFCKTGVPKSAAHDVEWEPHTEDEPRYLYIGEELVMKNGRLNEDRWASLNARVQAVEEMKAQKSHRRMWNTPASLQMDLQDLRKILDKLSSKITSASSSNSAESCPDTLDASEYLRCTEESKSLQPSTSLPNTSGFLERSKGTEGTKASLKVPSTESPKRHSPSKSPTSENKTSKEESSEAKRKRKSET